MTITSSDVVANVHQDGKVVVTIPARYYIDNYHRQENVTYVTLRPLPAEATDD